MSETKNHAQPVEPVEPVEPKEPLELQDDGEESDEYDNIEDDEEDGQGGYEEEEEDDDAGVVVESTTLTAMLLSGGDAEADGDEDDEDDDEDDEDDEDFTPLTVGNGIVPTLAGSTTEPVAGTKRARDDEEDAGENGKISGDYGEFEENSKTVNKKARAELEPEDVEG